VGVRVRVRRRGPILALTLTLTRYLSLAPLLKTCSAASGQGLLLLDISNNLNSCSRLEPVSVPVQFMFSCSVGLHRLFTIELVLPSTSPPLPLRFPSPAPIIHSHLTHHFTPTPPPKRAERHSLSTRSTLTLTPTPHPHSHLCSVVHVHHT
jgi:hypothetical protein